MTSHQFNVPPPNIDNLKEAISKSGKPLEIVMASYLENFGWQDICNSDSFYDKESNDLREIDIVASNQPKDIQNLQLETYLIIECKQSIKSAWIFYTRPFKFKNSDISGHYLDEAQMAAKNTEHAEILETILNDVKLHYGREERVAVTADILPRFADKNYNPEKDETGKDTIYAAENVLKKYIDWSTDQDIRKRTQVLPYSIEMFFPCIVFQGPMYEAIIKNGVVELTPTNHVIYKTLFRSRYSIYEKNVLIDVFADEPFKEDTFLKWQKVFHEDMESLEKAVTKNSGSISRRIVETLTLLESAHRRS